MTAPDTVRYPRRSLSVGTTVRLPESREALTWEVDSEAVEASCGVARVVRDCVGAAARVILRGRDEHGRVRVEQPATIVPWSVREDGLSIDRQSLGRVIIVYRQADALYFVDEHSLRVTRDQFKTSEILHTFSRRQPYRSDYPCILATPYGYFWRGETELIYSADLSTWRVELELKSRSMFHGLCSKRCERTGEELVYFAEYSLDSGYEHNIWRGRIRSPGAIAGWARVGSFASSKRSVEAPGLRPAARHLHLVTVDPYSGWLWVGTGDKDWESGIWVSRNDGETWELFALGKQEYRTLAIWFTERFVYWNMDTHAQVQRIFRAPKNRMIRRGRLQPITPILTAGMTQPGSTYFVLTGSGKQAPRTHRRYKESVARQIDGMTLVLLNDSRADYSEIVASLPFGAQWYQIPVLDKKGQEWRLMSAGPESRVPGTAEVPFRDWNARLFAMREATDGSFECHEVLTVEPDPNITDPKKLRYHRIDPRLQDDDGVIYFNSHNSSLVGALTGRLLLDS